MQHYKSYAPLPQLITKKSRLFMCCSSCIFSNGARSRGTWPRKKGAGTLSENWRKSLLFIFLLDDLRKQPVPFSAIPFFFYLPFWDSLSPTWPAKTLQANRLGQVDTGSWRNGFQKVSPKKFHPNDLNDSLSE